MKTSQQSNNKRNLRKGFCAKALFPFVKYYKGTNPSFINIDKISNIGVKNYGWNTKFSRDCKVIS